MMGREDLARMLDQDDAAPTLSVRIVMLKHVAISSRTR
jgi:hypothetical protein